MKRLILAALLAVFFPAVLASQQLTGSQGEDAQKKLDSFLLSALGHSDDQRARSGN
jgi:hypothetical protein